MADSKRKRKVDHIYCFIISTVSCCFKPLGKLLETKYVDIYIVSWSKETGGFSILGLTLTFVHNIIERMRAFSCSLYAWVQCCSVLILLTVGCKSRALWILFLDDGCWDSGQLLYYTPQHYNCQLYNLYNSHTALHQTIYKLYIYSWFPIKWNESKNLSALSKCCFALMVVLEEHFHWIRNISVKDKMDKQREVIPTKNLCKKICATAN